MLTLRTVDFNRKFIEEICIRQQKFDLNKLKKIYGF